MTFYDNVLQAKKLTFYSEKWPGNLHQYLFDRALNLG